MVSMLMVFASWPLVRGVEVDNEHIHDPEGSQGQGW